MAGLPYPKHKIQSVKRFTETLRTMQVGRKQDDDEEEEGQVLERREAHELHRRRNPAAQDSPVAVAAAAAAATNNSWNNEGHTTFVTRTDQPAVSATAATAVGQNSVNHLEEEILRLQTDNEVLLASNLRLKSGLEHSKAEGQTYHEELQRVREENQTYYKNIQTLNTDLARAKKSDETNEKLAAGHEEKFLEVYKTVNELNKQVLEVDCLRTSKRVLTQKVNGLTQEVNELTQEVRQLKVKFDELQENAKSRQLADAKELDQLKEYVAELEYDLETSKSRQKIISSMSCELEKLEEERNRGRIGGQKRKANDHESNGGTSNKAPRHDSAASYDSDDDDDNVEDSNVDHAVADNVKSPRKKRVEGMKAAVEHYNSTNGTNHSIRVRGNGIEDLLDYVRSCSYPCEETTIIWRDIVEICFRRKYGDGKYNIFRGPIIVPKDKLDSFGYTYSEESIIYNRSLHSSLYLMSHRWPSNESDVVYESV